MKLFRMMPSGALMLGLAITGCGGSGSSSTSSATQSASIVEPSSNEQASKSSASTAKSSASTAKSSASTAKSSASKAAKTSTSGTKPEVVFAVSSPALKKGVLPSSYTCDGADTSIPVQWSHIPHGVKELVLFVVSFEPSKSSTKPSKSSAKESYSWVVAGLQPTLKGIAAGQVPAGAVVGRNSAGQSRYSLCPAKGGGAQQYTAMVFGLSHPVAEKPGFSATALIKAMESMSLSSGGVVFSYTRK